VSEERIISGEDVDVENTGDRDGASYPAPLLRLLPAVTFGLRTAALAGMVVSAGAAAFGLAGVFDDPTNVAFTTCCGIENTPPPEYI
jgi:hypothetical protein